MINGHTPKYKIAKVLPCCLSDEAQCLEIFSIRTPEKQVLQVLCQDMPRLWGCTGGKAKHGLDHMSGKSEPMPAMTGFMVEASE